MQKILLSIVTLSAIFTATESLCKRKQQSSAPTQQAAPKTTTKKAKTGALNKEEYSYWYGRAEGLARMYEQKNQAKFQNSGGQYEQELESIRALKGAIQELNLNSKNKMWAEQAQELAQEYMTRHEDVTSQTQALQKVVNILKQIKKDWKTEFVMAQEGPEAASL